MRSLAESILSTNNARSTARQILDIFRKEDTVDNMMKLRELWEETGFLRPDTMWHSPVTGMGYNYEWIWGNMNRSIAIAIRNGKHLYIRKNTWSPKTEQEIVKYFNLKPIELPNTNKKLFETYEF